MTIRFVSIFSYKSKFSENKHVFPIRNSLSVVVHNCLKKSTFLTKFQFFSPKLAFLHKIDVEKNTRHFTPKIARHDFITGGQSISFVGKLFL